MTARHRQRGPRPSTGVRSGQRLLLGLGARHADVGQTGGESWVCLADPEGNEFCVLAGTAGPGQRPGS